MDRDEFIVLDYLDAFKLADESFIEEDTGIEKSRLSEILAKLSEKGLIKRVDGQWQIEKAGEEEAKRYREKMLEESGRKDEVLEYCRKFEELNARFKELVTRWQMKEEDGTMVPNDHSDPEYDMAILEQLNVIHSETKKLLEKLSEILPIYKRYIPRFEKALKLLMDGNIEYMDLDRQSYHNIWFELHESLLKLSGMKRVE